MTEKEWKAFKARLSESPFRSRFSLTEKEKAYVKSLGTVSLRELAVKIISERLAPEEIPNDGKQTPMKGHPVFKAQHATACCCRGCFEKWHHISKGHELTEAEKKEAVDSIMFWILDQMDGMEVTEEGDQPSLF